ncbi:MAG TPA: type II methionyl aminopeptidase [Methanothermococcus okinawensis]|uniref:Methionine aminopeptidase n=1 Tax=Methanothermococcus okinawensis TaxID=155863 RepID=A0A833DQ82_9EURY|nr:type II methionyl aminopeptidase [Methanothermococcus okinawensis]
MPENLKINNKNNKSNNSNKKDDGRISNDDPNKLEKLINAGKIHNKVMEEALKLIKPGEKLYNVAEYVENRIRELGGQVAFPCNISINEVAAHYTPCYGDKKVFLEGDLVKLDIGVHIDGYIADGALTIDLSNTYNDLIKASEYALNQAINEIIPPMNVGKIGAIIQEAIEGYGYKPISNLSGHVMEKYILHSGVNIPNIKENSKEFIDVGDVVAIEPFATDGFGQVVDGVEKYIFKYLNSRPVRLPLAKTLLKLIEKKYPFLPFSERDVLKENPKYRPALKNLMNSGCIYGYPVLTEKNRGMVSQSEHTVLITENGAKIITKS